MFWEWVKNWFFSLVGIDLIVKAMEAGTEIPAQAYLPVFRILH